MAACICALSAVRTAFAVGGGGAIVGCRGRLLLATGGRGAGEGVGLGRCRHGRPEVVGVVSVCLVVLWLVGGGVGCLGRCRRGGDPESLIAAGEVRASRRAFCVRRVVLANGTWPGPWKVCKEECEEEGWL